jgi:hypothetical protein
MSAAPGIGCKIFDVEPGDDLPHLACSKNCDCWDDAHWRAGEKPQSVWGRTPSLSSRIEHVANYIIPIEKDNDMAGRISTIPFQFVCWNNNASANGYMRAA